MQPLLTEGQRKPLNIRELCVTNIITVWLRLEELLRSDIQFSVECCCRSSIPGVLDVLAYLKASVSSTHM